MNVQAFGDLRGAVRSAGASTESAQSAQVAVAELAVLRLDGDLHAPEHATLAEPFVEAYRAVPSRGDALRLPVRAPVSELRVHAALHRLLEAAPSPRPVAEAQREGALRAALTAIQETRRAIRESGPTRA